MMKRTILAIAITLTTASAFAAPSPSAYDRIQDGRISAVEHDLNSTKDGVLIVNAKADAALSESSSALKLAGEAKSDAQRANDRLDNLPVPKDGKDGRDGIDGKDGLDGKDGINGTNGINGKDGVDGKNGTDGVNGLDGVDGAPGKDGAKGDTGATGADGINGADGRNGTDGTNGKDADMDAVNAQINAATQHSNQQFASLKQQIDDNHKKANAGSASAMAAAGVPQVTGNQTFTLGAAVGGYESENAIAVGASYRASESVTLKATVAADTQQGLGYNAGIAIGW